MGIGQTAERTANSSSTANRSELLF